MSWDLEGGSLWDSKSRLEGQCGNVIKKERA